MTSFVSDLIGLAASTNEVAADDGAAAAPTEADASTSQRATASIHTAVVELARAVVASDGAGEVELQSANLNLTTEARGAAEVAARPIRCDTPLAEPATVAMPTTILDAADGVNASLPIEVVLYTTPNLHTTLNASASTYDIYGASEMPTGASPTVSFALTQVVALRFPLIPSDSLRFLRVPSFSFALAGDCPLTVPDCPLIAI